MADPTGSISGCFWWLESDSGVYKDAGTTLAANGETVQQWNDQSGAGNHATQATSGKRPVYNTDQINNLPSLRFDNSDDALVGPAKSSGALTLFIIYNQRNATNTSRRAVGGSNNWLIGPYSGQQQTYMGGFLSNNKRPVAQHDFTCVCITQNGTTGKFYVGNVDITSGNATGFPGTMNLGGGSGAFVEPLDGDIAAVVAYDTVLSSSDRALVFNYLANKYNVPGLTSPTEPVATVTGCILHLDAAASCFKNAACDSPADGDAIYQWLDKAGRGWRFVQATGANQPLYKTNIVNGLPVLRFDGSNDKLLSGHYLERPYTVFMVYATKVATTGVNKRALQGLGDWFMGHGANKVRHYAVTGYVSDTLAEVVDAFILGTATNNSSTSSYHVNETDRTSSSTPIGNPQQLYVGGGASSDFFNGDIAEILVYNSALSSGDRRKVWDYLGPKYGLFLSSVAGVTFRVAAFIG